MTGGGVGVFEGGFCRGRETGAGWGPLYIADESMFPGCPLGEVRT